MELELLSYCCCWFLLIPSYIFDAIVIVNININIIYFIAPFKFSHVLASNQYLKKLFTVFLLAQDEKLIHLSNGIVNTNFYFSLWLSDTQRSVS